MCTLSSIIHEFKNGNVCVTGLRGRGKDMLFANVVMRRKKPYISNVNYGGDWYPFEYEKINCGENSYRNFISGDLNYYSFPYPDGTDVYLSDVGVYFPSQYNNLLNRDFPSLATFMAISRHVGNCNFHLNVQNLNRAFDKLREQSDIYISCRFCKVLFGKIVIQGVRLYDRYQSCIDRIPPFRVRTRLMSTPKSKDELEVQREKYAGMYGMIKDKLLIYINKSNYNTRVFKSMLEDGKR